MSNAISILMCVEGFPTIALPSSKYKLNILLALHVIGTTKVLFGC